MVNDIINKTRESEDENMTIGIIGAMEEEVALLKDAMTVTPVIVCCYEGVDAVEVVRQMAGATNGRKSAPGTIRGDFSMSFQENIVHTSDSKENAAIELKRFFNDNEIFDYNMPTMSFLYAADEL